MLTKLAEEDLKSLRKMGCEPTDAEIVELNDLALRIERGKFTTPSNHPRIGFANNVILHEPTIGALEWWSDYGKNAFILYKWRMYCYFFCLHYGRDLDVLDKLHNAREIKAAVKKWVKTLDCTMEELWRALFWVKFGDIEYQKVEQEDYINNTLKDEKRMDLLWSTVITAAGATGILPKDLRTLTQSELYSTIIQSNLHAKIPMKNSIAEDYISYTQLLKKIEERHLNGQQT